MNTIADTQNSSDRDMGSPGQEQFPHSEELHQARYAMYKMLSLAYLYPGDIDWNTFLNELPEILEEAAGILPLDITTEIATLSILSHSLELKQICCEHTLLFINNPNKNPIAPYESVYLEDTIMGRCTQSVQELYEQYGLAVDQQHSYLLPDHIALELDFMACLIEKSLESGASSLEEQNSFFDNHTGRWAQQFLADIKDTKPDAYFTLLATVADKFFQYEKHFFASLA